MIKIGLVAVLATLLAAPLKKEKQEIVLMIGIAATTLIGLYGLAQFTVIATFIESIWEKLPVENSFLVQLLKMLGITYIAEFAASICRENGYDSIAGQVELFAKFTVLALSIPGLNYLVGVVESFL